MKNQLIADLRQIRIAPVHWDVPMRVELTAYLDFIYEMNRQLRELVIKHGDASMRKEIAIIQYERKKYL